MARILLTAFEPFGGESINPSLEIAKRLERCADVDILTVPVTFHGCANAVLPHLAGHDCVVMLGQAMGRKGLTFERIAINVDDASAPDNAGHQPVDEPIDPNGPAAYFSTLPIRSMAEAVRRIDLSASISNSAGTYVCNHLMYSVLNALAGQDIRAGFVHVPALPEQVKNRPEVPSMPLDDMVRAIEAALDIL